MRLGLEHADWRVVWANDIDKDKRAMYSGHFVDGGDHFHLGDVHKLENGCCAKRMTDSWREDIMFAGKENSS
jgi:site-specific DNA-cytosine methylase